MTQYYRPLVQTGSARPTGAVTLHHHRQWFTHAEVLERNAPARIIAATDIPQVPRDRLCAPRAPIAGLNLDQPQIMGILNVTPDSFSDGGQNNAPDVAQSAARAMIDHGASLIDIGGESTRPGAVLVPDAEEIARTAPVIKALRDTSDIPISIDTRKTSVARAALQAGADIVNDVSGFTFDADLAPLCAHRATPVCVMHAQGDPATMQHNPTYDDVLLDVYDFLNSQITALEAMGIPRAQIIADPGIGFGKTQEHNLLLLQNISLFHGLGCAILLGASRKRFIGTVGFAPDAATRMPGSVAVGLAALAQGVQLLRVHDVAQTAQAVRLWNAVR